MARWWDRQDSSEAEAAKDVYRMGSALYEDQGKARERYAHDCLTLYYGNERNGLRGYSSTLSAIDDWMGPEPPGYNVIQACTDTIVAHIVRNKVRPMFLTERGNYQLKEKALGMQRAVEAIFTEAGIYGDLGVDVCWDGNLFDAGGVKCVPDYVNLRPLVERVFPWRVFVSDREALLGRPRSLFEMMVVDRAIAEDLFKDNPDALEIVKNAPPAPADLADTEIDNPGQVADQIVLYEAYHLPSGRVDRDDPRAFGRDDNGEFNPKVDTGHDGRRVVVCNGEFLLDVPWAYDYFPYAWFRPMKKRIGYWSRGIPETLAGAQLALNRMNARVDGIMDLHAVPTLLVWRQAKINLQKWNNSWAKIIETSVPPSQAAQLFNPQSVPAEYINRIERIIAWAEKQVGLSEMSIQASKPPGVDHAPGMQHLQDTESIRHTPRFRSWEQFHVDLSRIVVDCLRQLAEYAHQTDQSLELLWGDSKQLQRINWRDVDLKESQYHLKTWPTNLLPQTPAAKLSRVFDLIREQLISREEALTLLDFPDLESATGDIAAAQQNIEQRLDALFRGGDYQEHMPHTYLNLALAKKIAVNRINQLEADGAPDEKIDMLRQFYEDCVEFEREQMAADVQAQAGVPPPPDGGVPAAPPGAPMAPPAPPGAPPMPEAA